MKTTTLPPPTFSLTFQYNVISAEALSVHKPVTATVHKLSAMINQVANEFKNTDILGAIDALFRKETVSAAHEKHVLAWLRQEAYSDVMGIRLPCIGGLSVPWLTLLHHLDQPVQFAVGFYDNTLSQTTRFLAEVVTSPDNMDSIARRYTMVDGKYETLTEPLRRDLNGPRKQGELPLGKLIKRNADMEEVMALTHRFSAQLYASNQELVNERITQIKRQLQTISADMVDPNIPYRMTGRNVEQLANVALNIAKAVEHYGVIMAIFTEHKRTFEQAIQKLHHQR